MITNKHIFTCPACLKGFFSYHFPNDDHYGEFIMRAKNGQIRYLNSFKDSVFDEFSKLYDIIKESNDLATNKDVEVFQSLFSHTCDTADDGSRFEIGRGDFCPYCGYNGSNLVADEIVENVKINVMSVTHSSWEKLTEIERKDLIATAYLQYFTSDST